MRKVEKKTKIYQKCYKFLQKLTKLHQIILKFRKNVEKSSKLFTMQKKSPNCNEIQEKYNKS